MTSTAPSQLPVPNAPERSRRKHRWLRWTIAGTATFVVLVVGLVAAAIKLQPTPDPLAVPANASAPVARTVTVPLSLRRDGTNIDVAGSIPVAFADYGITGPKGYGALGSLAEHGEAEFLLVLQRS